MSAHLRSLEHRRHLQTMSDGPGFGGTLLYFAIVLAFIYGLWACCRPCIRSSLANSSRDDLPHTAPPTTGPDPPGQGGAPLPARQQPASSSNRPGAPLSAISISERRAFLEQALLVHQPNPASRRRLSSSKLVDADQTEDPEEVCAICLEDCSAASSASTSPTSHNGSGGGKALCRSFNSRCQHVFHRDCILDWLVHDETCPCCRQPFLEFYDDADADADAAGETDDDNTTAVASLEEEGDDDVGGRFHRQDVETGGALNASCSDPPPSVELDPGGGPSAHTPASTAVSAEESFLQREMSRPPHTGEPSAGLPRPTAPPDVYDGTTDEDDTGDMGGGVTRSRRHNAAPMSSDAAGVVVVDASWIGALQSSLAATTPAAESTPQSPPRDP